MTDVTVLHRARTTIVIHPDVTIKTYRRPTEASNEISYYRLIPWACPTLIHYNTKTGTLVIETLPLAGNNPHYQPVNQLRELLRKLEAAHIHHRDVHIHNIVAGPGGPLLIDWESATHAAAPSYDLYGPDKTPVPIPDIHTACGPQWWNSDDWASIKNQWRTDVPAAMV